MKYCLLRDQPLSTGASGEQLLTGCKIFGVWHDCKGCPNLTEMGDEVYSASQNGLIHEM